MGDIMIRLTYMFSFSNFGNNYLETRMHAGRILRRMEESRTDDLKKDSFSQTAVPSPSLLLPLHSSYINFGGNINNNIIVPKYNHKHLFTQKQWTVPYVYFFSNYASYFTGIFPKSFCKICCPTPQSISLSLSDIFVTVVILFKQPAILFLH